MRHLLSTCSISCENLNENEIRSKFFTNSLNLQSFPIDKLRLSETSIYINEKSLFRYLVEYEGIPIKWKDIISLEMESLSIIKKISDSINLVKNYSEEAFKYCWNSNFINAFFINTASKFKSGSSSTSVGLSFFCIDNSWTKEKIAESYLHEGVHNSLFIEDMIRSVFTKQEFLENENSKVLSPIRKKIRNYDFAFHAACVSIELLKFYKFMNEGEKYDKLLKSTYESIKNLKEVYFKQSASGMSPLTENGFTILIEMEEEIQNI